MLPDGVRRLVNYWSIKPAERAVVLTMDDRGLQAAADLEAAGVEVARVVDFRERTPSSIEAQGRKGRVAQVAIDGHWVKCDLARHVRQPAAQLQAARAGRRPGRVRRRQGCLRPARPARRRRGRRRRHRRRRLARGTEPDARPRRRQVLRLLLRGPDGEGPQVRDRRGLRLDRALEAVHDGDDGARARAGSATSTRSASTRSRPGWTRTRSGRRRRGRRTRRWRWASSPVIRRSLPSARRCTTATRSSAPA